MPNRDEFLSELEVDREIKKKGDRQLLEFVAHQVYEAKKVTGRLETKVLANTKRSVTNQIALIVLIILLISLGVIDRGILRIFGI